MISVAINRAAQFIEVGRRRTGSSRLTRLWEQATRAGQALLDAILVVDGLGSFARLASSGGA